MQMTLLEQAIAQYVEICSRSEQEKRNAWQQAQETAANFPDILGDLPDLLKAEMLRRRLNAQQTGG